MTETTLSIARTILVPILFLVGAGVFMFFLSGSGALFVLVGLAISVLAFVRPAYVIGLLIILIPLEPFVLKFVPDEMYAFVRYASEALIYLLLISSAIHLARGKSAMKRDIPLFLFLSLLFAIFVSAFVNHTPADIAFLGARQMIRFIFVFFIIRFFSFPTRIHQVLIALVVGMALLEATLGIVQRFGPQSLDSFLLPDERKTIGALQLTPGTYQFWEPGERVFGTLGRYDQLGAFLLISLMLVLGFLYAVRNKKIRKYLSVGFFVLLAACFLTYARASWFGFLIGFFLIALGLYRDRRVWYGTVGIVILFAMYLGTSGIVIPRLVDLPSQTPAERFLEAFSQSRWRGEYYAAGRLFFMVHTPGLIIQYHPLFGVGPGSYGGGVAAATHYTSAYDMAGLPFGIWGTEGHIDNNWFSLWGEIGTVGLLLYTVFFGSIIWKVVGAFRRTNDEFKKSFFGGFLGLAAAACFIGFLAMYFEMRTFGFYLWLLAGIAYVEAERSSIDKTPRGFYDGKFL